MSDCAEAFGAHVCEFKNDGFTVFPGFLGDERVGELRALLDPVFERLAVDPTMLDYVELAMGPFVQADRFEVSSFPVRDASRRGQPEPWNVRGRGTAGVHACNCLIYLQEVSEETGPFRLIPEPHHDTFELPLVYRMMAEDRRALIG